MLRPICLLLAATLLQPSHVLAQSVSTATLAGSVLDPDGKIVVGAAIVARNAATGEIRTTTTDSAGRFSLNGLSDGQYTVEVFVPGFETVRRTGVTVAGNGTEDISVRLTV